MKRELPLRQQDRILLRTRNVCYFHSVHQFFISVDYVTHKIESSFTEDPDSIKKTFCYNQTFITVFAKLYHWPLYFATRIQYTYSQPNYLADVDLDHCSFTRISQMVSYFDVFRPKFCMCLSLLPCVLHGRLISYSLI